MPVATKQSPTNNRAVKANVDNILDDAIPVEDIESAFIKIAVYGQNRTGKTTLACTFPKPLLLISFEPNLTGGALSVKREKGVTLKIIKTHRDAMVLAERLGKDNRSNWTEDLEKLTREDGKPLYDGVPFKTHVLDSVTSFQDLVLQELLNLPTIPEQLAWGLISGDDYRKRSEKIKESLRPFLNLSANTVALAGEKDHSPSRKDSDGKVDMRPRMLRGPEITSFYTVDLGGGAADWLHSNCDYITRLYVEKEIEVVETPVQFQGKKDIRRTERETGRTVHKLLTKRQENFYAGFRSSTPEKVPDFITIEMKEGEPTAYEKIKSIIDGE